MAKKYSSEILNERAKTYGSFQENALVVQELKRVVRAHSYFEKLSPDKKESIDMIFAKISRIVIGNSEHKDSWDDIVGYAELIASTLEKEIN